MTRHRGAPAHPRILPVKDARNGAADGTAAAAPLFAITNPRFCSICSTPIGGGRHALCE